MKKETKRFMALLLSLTLVIGSFSGCMSGDNSSNSSNSETTDSSDSGSSSGSENTGVTAEDEEIFTIVKNAYNAMMDYTGAYTRTAVTKSDDDSEETDVLSVDPIANKLYHKNHYGRIEKIYPHEDAYVSYIKEYSERFIQHNADYAAQRIHQFFLLESALNINYSSLEDWTRTEMFQFDSLADYKSKLTPWIQDSATIINEQSMNEDSDWFGYSNANATVDVFGTANNDGTHSLTIKETFGGTYSEGGNIATYEADFITPYVEEYLEAKTSVITVKDGKMISFSCDCASKATRTEVENGESFVETDESTNTIKIDISYDFDQEGFDAILLETPTEMEQGTVTPTPTYNFQKPVKIFVGDSTIELVAEGETRESTMKDVLSSVGKTFQTLTLKGISHTTWTPVSAVEIKFYKDAACTQELNLNLPTKMLNDVPHYGGEYTDVEISEADYNALETVYVKATLSNEYAFINASNTYAYSDDVPESYLPFASLDEGGEGIGGIIPAGAYNPNNFKWGHMPNIKPHLNGVEITDEMQVEGGTVYDIVYFCLTTEEDLNFFNYFM